MRCETCNITLNSEHQAKQHFAGKNHARRISKLVSQLEESKKAEEGGDKTQQQEDEDEETVGGDATTNSRCHRDSEDADDSVDVKVNKSPADCCQVTSSCDLLVPTNQSRDRGEFSLLLKLV